MAKQRLILLFDGTWNDPEDQTNVFRIARHIRNSDGAIRQRFYYDPGVGTERFNKFMGGAFGFGLNRNIRQGYEWLAEQYVEGDEIWMFGFSRGAYTARSLAGLIRKCGLLHVHTPTLVKRAFEVYRDKSAKPDEARCASFRSTYSREPRIHFLGVWDTVGSLGMPKVVEHASAYTWHDTELSSWVDRAYHAMALDEHRAMYEVPLWVTDDGRMKPRNLDVEQRWFIGAHANVGGGYGSDDPLPDPSLAWMMRKAADAGLKLDAFTPRGTPWLARPTDSYRNFVGGLYPVIKGRYHRKFNTGYGGKPAVNVTVDESVWKRWMECDEYRPKTLVDAGIRPPMEME